MKKILIMFFISFLYPSSNVFSAQQVICSTGPKETCSPQNKEIKSELSKKATAKTEPSKKNIEKKIGYKSDLCTLLPNNNGKEKEQLTIKEAIEMGYKCRPSLQAFKALTRSQQKIADSKMSGYLPQLSVTGPTANVYPKHDRGVDAPTINITQLIYNPAGPQDEYKIQMRDVKSSKYAEEAHKDLIRHQVEHAFLKAWVLDEKRDFINSLKVASEEIYKKSKTKTEAGLLDKQGTLQAQTEIDKENAAVGTYFSQLYPSKGRLEYFLGKKFFCHNLNNRQLYWDYFQEVGEVDPLDVFCQKAVIYRKEIKSKNEEIQKAELQRKFYAKKHYPSVGMTSNLGQSNQTYSFAMSWNIFDGLSSRFTSDSYKALKIKAEMEKADLIQKIKLEVEEEYYAVKILIRDLEAKTTALRSAKNALDLTREKLQVGLVTTIELSSAKETWEKSQFEWLEFRVGVELKKSDLNFVCGYPPENHLNLK